jgi:hypothetical protein
MGELEAAPATVEDGARGVKFITSAVESSSRRAVWVDAGLEL